ncbi:MAG: hypothetical protein K940chlam7_01001 [Chlamydiae bacterium]|nr:hypothetical protein [Chlamydiota bacterium]
MDGKLFQKNVELWACAHPKEAVWLPYIDCDHLQFCKTKKGQANLKVRENSRTHYYHSNVDAKKEAERWFAKLDLKGVDVLYIYGVGLGYYFDAAKSWLKKGPEKHLVFLEDDLAVVHRLFETRKGSEILKHEQVSLYHFNEISDTEVIFNELFWNFVMSKIDFSCLKYYEKIKGEKFTELHHQISYDAATKNGLLEEYLEYGIAFFRNFYSNMPKLADSSLGNTLFGQFKNIPAVICGAGPSLQKNISLLKTIGDRAIIFGGSSSLNALSAAGIVPHLGAGIDPNPMQEERLSQVQNLSFPFLYRNRMFPKALDLVTGPKLYITGAGGYDISEWFENKLDIDGEVIEEGRNVVNFCLEVAHAMGCNPIIFVGMDLAYTGMKEYTTGVLEQTTVTEKEILEAEDFNDVPLKKTDIRGKTVYTLWKWVAESKWIGNFAETHPEVTLINATEGGLGFPGVPNKTLAHVVRKHLQRRYRVKSRIDKQIENAKMPRVTKKKIHRVMRELLEGLHRCMDLLNVLSDENERLKREIKKKKKVEHMQTGKGALAETELSEEPAYVYVLQIFNAVFSRVLQRDLRKVYHPTTKISELEHALFRLDLNKKKYTLLKNVATVNIELIKHSLNAKAQRRKGI